MRQIYRGGFALPTVLIASVVMMIVLAVSVTSVVAVRTSLKVQYYEQLAKTAGEAGVAYAKACLAKNGNVPLWSDAKPLTPATDCAGNTLLSNNPFSALVVAGGGSGGGSTGGGGGGGGVIENDFYTMSTGSYAVTVGAGGAVPGNQKPGKSGGNSTFNGWTAIGGGGGAYSASGNVGAAGLTGGSGGGGDVYGGSYAAGNGTAGQGYGGGSITGIPATSTTGGGGAGGSGLVASVATSGGDGGPGIASSITGTTTYYGGGGGGGGAANGTCGNASGQGGIGGGGNGGDIGSPGTANTGGGGGGGWCYASGNGGAGGSGVVIISYPDNGSITATGGDQIYSAGAYKIHVFKSSGTFTVSNIGASSCPTDPRCSVTVNDNIRSSFSVGKPAVDSNGRALTIPNNGYVQLLRSSTGQVWRTYQEPATQAVVVPDLCSGAASSTLGWSNAVVSSAQTALPNAPGAQTITLANGNLNAGQMYFRKDFTVTQAGTYTTSVQTTSTSDLAEIYIDGSLVTTAQGQLGSSTVSLAAGCHTVTVRLTNKTLFTRPSQFTAAIQQAGASPIVATDSSWRVSSGASVSFSGSDYYADPSIWTTATQASNQASSYGWGSSTLDRQAQILTAACASSCPPSSSTYFRDSRDFILTGNAEVLVSALCDDDCAVYIDGSVVMASAPWSSIQQETITLTAGVHHVGVRLYNAGSATNPSGTAVALYDTTNNRVLTRTDTTWLTASNTWVSGTNAGNDPMSYEASFTPSPSEIATPASYDVLVVGGGGGGGGNCNTCGGAGGGGGGGVQYAQNVTATLGTQTVTVGAGGNGGAGGTSRTNGTNGGISTFGSISVVGGGGGGAQLGIAGNNGASGGGGAGGNSPAAGAGGTGVTGIGSAGGAGAASAAFNGGGGGGAGGVGMVGTTAVGGNGGPGFITYMNGSRIVVGAGGGGGSYGAVPAGYGDDGAGNGATPSTNSGKGYSGTANTGGGGGGANGSTTGATGGAGGSGVVVLRFVKNSLTFTLGGSGARTQADVTVNGTLYTVITFTSGTSTFQITAINS